MSSTVTQNDVSNLQKQIEQLGNMLSQGSRGIEGLHLHSDAPVVSFFETDSQPSMAKAMRGRPLFKNRAVSMPKGYTKSDFDTFGEFVRLGMKDEVGFTNKHNKAIASLAKSLNVNTSDFGDGGALVLPEFAPEIMRMLYESESLWGRTRQYTVAGNSMKFPRLRDQNRADGTRHGGVLGYWLGEADAITESKVAFDTTDLSLNKLAIAVFLTEEMISDSGYAIEQFVTEVAQAEIDYQLDKALLRANGVGKPLGILSSPSRVTVAAEGGQSADTIVPANIEKMWTRRLDAGAGDDLVWIYNQDIEEQLGKLAMATGSSSGQLVYQGPTGLAGAPYGTLKGRPLIPSEHASTLGNEGDLMLVNFRHYLSINKGQVNQLASPHVQFLRDLLCLKFTFRVNGRPAYDTPVTTEQSAQTRSAFITLAAR